MRGGLSGIPNLIELAPILHRKEGLNMAWKIYFRVTILTAAGIIIIEIGYPSGTTALIGKIQQTATFASESAAIGKALSFNRRMQSAGVDCYAEVFGKPLNLNATPIAGMVVDTKVSPSPPLRALTGPELAEQTYARVDTPDLELRQAVSLANSTVAGTTVLAADLPEDVGDRAAGVL